jgi:hypothetical protein
MMIKLVKNFEKQCFEKENIFSTNYNMNMTFSYCAGLADPL